MGNMSYGLMERLRKAEGVMRKSFNVTEDNQHLLGLHVAQLRGEVQEATFEAIWGVLDLLESREEDSRLHKPIKILTSLL